MSVWSALIGLTSSLISVNKSKGTSSGACLFVLLFL